MLRQVIKDKVINAEKATKINSCSGIVMAIKNMRADVRIRNQFGQGYLYLKQVPIVSQSSAIKLSDIAIGDRVYIDFDGGFLSGARIVGSIDNKYKSMHSISNAKKIKQVINYTRDYKKVLKSDIGTISGTNIDNMTDMYFEKMSSFSEKSVGMSLSDIDAVIKIDEDGSVVLSAGLSSITLKQNGQIDIESNNIVYK